MKAKTVRLLQGSPDWIEWRRWHIGSSDAPVIVGESPYRSALDLYYEKTQGESAVDPDTARLFRLGHAMEPLILSLYAEDTGRKVRRGRVLEDREIPWLSASLDGETSDGRIVEAKWTSSRRWDNGIPGDVVTQVTHQMAVAGRDVADVAVLTGRSFDIYTVTFDRDLWDSILALEEQFTRRLTLGLPPPPDGSESSRKALTRLHPEDNGEMIEADAEVRSLVLGLIAAKAERDGIEAKVAEMENALRFILGDASGVEGPGFRVTYRKTKDSLAVAWEEYAGSLEKVIAESAPDRASEVETIRGLYTSVKQGSRRLLVKSQEVEG